MSQSNSDLLSDEDKYLMNVMLNEPTLDSILDQETLLLDSPLAMKDLILINELSQDEILYMENMDQKDTFIIPNQPQSQNVLTKEQYAGPYEFEVEVDNPNNSNNGYMYSANSKKIYTKMNSQVQIAFKVIATSKQLYIRVTPVYSQAQYAQELVQRCINHKYKDNEKQIKQHIMRCGNSHVQYLGDVEKNERLSMVIPLSQPQTGTDRVMEMFQFVCQNSCPAPGMNRRPIEVIFTLEDVCGTIYGRQTFQVRVCCSPKRDMMKDKDICDKNLTSKGKKRKMEKPDKTDVPSPTEVDTNEYSLRLNIVGKHNVQSVLKYCQDLMAGEVLSHKNEDAEECFRKCHDNISTMRGQLE